MSSARRAYDLVRGYVNREFDRISGLGQSPEEKELDDALGNPTPASYGSGPTPTAEEQELNAPVGGGYRAQPGTTQSAMTPEEARAHACQILGVQTTAPFQEIRKAYETLNQRSDPTRFPEASQERIQAVTIQRRIQWAYKKLTENLDSTEMRFRTLEID